MLVDVARTVVGLLFPHLTNVPVDGVTATSTAIRFDASTFAPSAERPLCGCPPARMHSRYVRRIADLAVAGREVVVRLVVRRFRHVESGCPRSIFSEQVTEVVGRYQRRSPILSGGVGADRAGARWACRCEADPAAGGGGIAVDAVTASACDSVAGYRSPGGRWCR